MNDISVVSYIKNDIEFVEQFWKHIHTYDPREIAIVDTGSTDGTFEALLSSPKSADIIYKIEQWENHSGRVFSFNKAVYMATSAWVIKLDVDELLSKSTQQKIFETIAADEYNCISIPTIHHFINSDLFFNCIDKHPDYHERIFKRDAYGTNLASDSRNHGSVVWSKPLYVLKLGIEHPLYHYSLLRSFEKIQKRSIINYYIDIEKITDEQQLKYIDQNIGKYIEIFKTNNPQVTPAWQTQPTLVNFNDLEDYYIGEFIKWGSQVDFKKPEDLIVNKISTWERPEKEIADKTIKHLTFRGKKILFKRNGAFWAGVREVNGWQPDAFDVFDKYIKRGDVFLDIGAWNGVCSIYASLLGAKCYAVEPDMTAFEELKENIEINKSNCEIRNVSISNVTGSGYLSNHTKVFGNSMSSLINRHDSDIGYLVPTYTLEDFIISGNITPTFIKMDIEASEILVIPSSANILKKLNCPLYLELHPFWFPDLEKNMNDIADVLFDVYDVGMTREEFTSRRGNTSLLLIPKQKT